MDSKELKRLFDEADALLVTAGAGMGVDSGLPDFRGDEGFWKAYPPIGRLGYSFAEMANPRWFDENPNLAWGFYGHRLHLYRSTVPHEGFERLLEAGRQKRHGYFIFTSNVDGQFQKAGFDEKRILECHGSIHHLQCSQNCSDAIWSASDTQVRVDEASFEAQGALPPCPNCGAIARPNILMFGDWGWNAQRSDAQEQRFGQWLESLKSAGASLVIVELGAGEAVPTVRMTSEQIARALEATLIRINPRDDAVPQGQYALRLGALEGVKRLS